MTVRGRARWLAMAVATRVANGPQEADSIHEFAVGIWLWWRTWAALVCIVAPYLAGMYALEITSPAGAIWVTWLATFFLAHYARSIGPKSDD